MSNLNVDNIADSAGSGQPDLINGVTIEGEASADSIVALGGTFTAGTNLRIRAVGGVVTITADQVASHASLTGVGSQTGLVPVALRPTADVCTVYKLGGSHMAEVCVQTTGAIAVAYRDYSGSLSARSDTVSPITITYTIA